MSVMQRSNCVETIRTTINDPVLRNQIVKFLSVGLLNVIVGYGSFFILLNYLNYLVALLVAHFIGVTNSFIWNKLWVFKTKTVSIIEFLRFNVVYALVYLTNAGSLYVCVDIFKVDPRPAQLFLLPVVTIISFFGQKLWTFHEKKAVTA